MSCNRGDRLLAVKGCTAARGIGCCRSSRWDALPVMYRIIVKTVILLPRAGDNRRITGGHYRDKPGSPRNRPGCSPIDRDDRSSPERVPCATASRCRLIASRLELSREVSTRETLTNRITREFIRRVGAKRITRGRCNRGQAVNIASAVSYITSNFIQPIIGRKADNAGLFAPWNYRAARTS